MRDDIGDVASLLKKAYVEVSGPAIKTSCRVKVKAGIADFAKGIKLEYRGKFTGNFRVFKL